MAILCTVFIAHFQYEIVDEICNEGDDIVTEFYQLQIAADLFNLRVSVSRDYTRRAAIENLRIQL